MSYIRHGYSKYMNHVVHAAVASSIHTVCCLCEAVMSVSRVLYLCNSEVMGQCLASRISHLLDTNDCLPEHVYIKAGGVWRSLERKVDHTVEVTDNSRHCSMKQEVYMLRITTVNEQYAELQEIMRMRTNSEYQALFSPCQRRGMRLGYKALGCHGWELF